MIGFILTALFAFPIAHSSVYSSMALLIACLVLCGWGINFMSASMSGYIAMNYPPSIVGRMVGWWFGFSCFGGAVGLYIGGQTIGTTGSFKLAITMMSFAAVAGFITTLFLKQKR
jgi:MFS family permease